MDLPRVPPAIVGGIADLVPHPIRKIPCFLDRLTGLWRYDFGEPCVDLPRGGVVLGTQMYQEVDRLFDVLACAHRRLPDEVFQNYLARLADPKKHDDLIFEFAPILRLPVDMDASYEVSGLGEGNRTIDWLIKPKSGVSIALEVKNRPKDLLESLVRLQAGERDVDGTAPAPLHDAGLLFASLEQKFRPRDVSEMVQGAWIGTDLRQEESELMAAFARLDPTRVHVAFFGDWKDDAYVLSHSDFARQHAREVLGVRESRRFVFRRSERITTV
jgi:hypothetical protein